MHSSACLHCFVFTLFTSFITFFICRAIEIQHELDEYTENSAQLEKELEASLGQVEKQNRDLEHQNQRLKNEIETLRVCSQQFSIGHSLVT